MKNYIAISAAVLCCGSLAQGQIAQNATWQHTADRVLVDFDLDMTNVKVRSNQRNIISHSYIRFLNRLW